MFAVVYLGGKQYKVREKDEIEVDKLDLEPGKNLKVNEVLLMGEEDGSDVKLGMPFVGGAHVECQVMEHGKGEKIRVFKFKAKKRYHRTQGHRQQFTLLKVLKISAVEKKASAAKEEKVEAPEMDAVVEKKPAAKKPAAKKTKKEE
jgi:large subunit ribosomal protein L21